MKTVNNGFGGSLSFRIFKFSRLFELIGFSFMAQIAGPANSGNSRELRYVLCAVCSACITDPITR